MRSWRKHEDETGEYLIVGGQNHKVGQDQKADQNYLELESWAKEYFPVKEVAFRWSTQDNWTPDGLPFVGRSPDKNRLFVATGFAGWGMSNGIVSGKILSDEILAIQNPWAETYNPSRQVLTRLGTLVKENINVASHLIGDRAARAEFKNWEEVQPGQAGILQLPDKRVAAYRSADGVLHAVESACSHMGCQVAWNSAENSWDCPCHGSRFSIDGDVLHGPAVSPLAQVDAAKESSVGYA
jgi:Rieske Fe-S protein